MTPTALLEQLGLPEYRHAFYQDGVVDVRGLMGLSDARLRSLGVTNPEHRERILGAVANLRSTESPEPTQVPEPRGTRPSDWDGGETQAFVYGGTSSPTEPTEGPEPVSESSGAQPRSPVEPPRPVTWDLEEPERPPEAVIDDEDDDVSLDQHDGQVFAQLEADDDTDLPGDHPYGDQEDPLPAASGSLMGRLLIALVLLVAVAGVAGWFIVQEALRADEPVSVAPTAQPLPPRMPAPAAPAIAVAPPAAPSVAKPATTVGPPVAPAEREGPSFPCAKAESRVERLICSSASLSAQDRQLAEAYGDARRGLSGDAVTAVRDAQKRWLRSRDACTDESCVARRYSERLAELD